jgi:hypothetical protein
VGVILLLAGCFPVQQKLAWEPFPQYEAPTVAALVAHDPRSLLQGEAVPWDGILLYPDDLYALLDEYQRLVEAIDAAYTGRQEDRTYANESLDAAQTALTVCRQNLPRAFVAGAGAGAAACGLAVGVIAVGVAR